MRTSVTSLTACLAVSTLLATGCAGSGSGSGSGSGDIVFGQLLGVTGDYAPFSPPAIEAARIAVSEINEAGGVLDRKVRLVTEDNRSTVEGAVSGFSKLTNVDGASVLGNLESDAVVALFDNIADRGIPSACPACGTTFLDKRGGDYLFRFTGSDSDSGVIVAQLVRDAGHRTLGMIVQNTEGAAGPAEVARAALDGVEGTSINYVTVEPGANSYAAEVAQALKGNPDALYIGAGVEAGLPILREIERRGHDLPIYVSPDLVVGKIAGVGNADQLVGAISSFDTESPAYSSFAERYVEATGDEPQAGYYDANAYDQFIVFALAMEAAGSTDGAEVGARVRDVASAPGITVYSYAEGVKALQAGEEIDFDGASGPLDLNEYGNLKAPLLSVMAVRDGTWTPVETVAVDPSLRPAG